MLLKSLELMGFKSFVDRVTVEFPTGLTAIIGPNGCGKSNISDAVRWVMGEQSVKTLRGSRMEDVIFAGSEKRGPVGFAEVTMTLDNHTHLLNIDYEEVAITRRLYRSGESEYLINRVPCRLKDIHELLMDTGLGRDGYSVIGQGKIDEILYAKPEDRREVFEEAAGISKYKYRKIEAERKLAATDVNLTRIADILSEITGQLAPLREQSEKAARFLTLHDELKILDINLFFDALEKNERNREKYKADLDALQAEFAAKKEKVDKVQETVAALNRQNRDKEQESEAARESRSKTEQLIAAFTAQADKCEAQKKANEEQAKYLKREAQKTMDEAAQAAKASEELYAKKEEAEKKLAFDRAEAERQKEAEEAASQTVVKKGKALDALREQLQTLTLKIADTKSRIHSYSDAKEELEARLQTLAGEIKSNHENAAQQEENLQKLKANISEIEAGKRRFSEELRALRTQEAELRRALEDGKEAYNRMVHRENGLSARLKVVEELEREMEGYAGSVKALMAAHQEGAFNGLTIYGVLSKLLDTDEQYVTAVEVALGNAMQNVAVDSEETASTLIEYLKEHRLGRVTFLPVSSIRPKRLEQKDAILKETGAVAPASELVHCAPELSDIKDNLLGAVLIVDTMDHAIAIARKYRYKFKIVTLSGELLNTGGAITGGTLGRSQKLLGRSKEIQTLKQEIAALKKEYNKKETELARTENTLRECSLKCDNKTQELTRADMAIAQRNSEITLCTRLIDGYRGTAEKLGAEREKIAQRLTNAGAEKAALYEALRNGEEQAQTVQAQIDAAEPDYQKALSALEEARQATLDKAVVVSVSENSVEMLQFKIDELTRTLHESGQKRAQLLREAEACLAKNDALIEEQQMAQRNIEAAKGALSDIAETLGGLVKDREETARQIEDLLSKTKEQTEEVMRLQKNCTNAENRLERAVQERETLIARLWDDYELTFSTAEPLKTEMPSVSEAKSRAETIRREIRTMGSVNVSAIDEYKAVSERHTFLSGQQDDLLHAKTELLKVIADLTKKMEATFADRFRVIAEEFSASYQRIMGGGKAYLHLLDPEHILESGIEIDIQPPGKKLQNIMLLSGGEKALCAIALFFAFLEVRPSPFCILDEIEAALDENNVSRYVEMMKRKQDKTQFIVITHRRGTMEAADTVFGITMQDKGISKILEISLKDSEKGKKED